MGEILSLRIERPKLFTRSPAMSSKKVVEDRLPGGRMNARGVGEYPIQIENGPIEALARKDDIVVIEQLGSSGLCRLDGSECVPQSDADDIADAVPVNPPALRRQSRSRAPRPSWPT
jgi:hypothetical protein